MRPGARTVVHVVHDLRMGGAERRMLRLLGSLDPERYRAMLVCIAGLGPLLDEALAIGAEPTVLGRHRRWDARGMLRLARLVRDSDAQIVHGWLFMANGYARVGGRLGRAPIVIAAEGAAVPAPGRRRGPITRLIETAAAPFTDAYVANSSATAEGMRRLGVPQKKIAVIRNGVEVGEEIDDSARDQVRAELGVSPELGMVVMVARFDDEFKDHDTFLRSLAQLPGAAGVLVGEGRGRAAAEALAGALGIADRIRFTGFRADATRVAAAADVSVLLSRAEGMSNVVLESMAAATPVVATDVPANREAIRHRTDGLLVPVGDVERTVSAIGGLLGNVATRRTLGQAARARVRAEFSLGRQAEATMALYDELLARKRG